MALRLIIASACPPVRTALLTALRARADVVAAVADRNSLLAAAAALRPDACAVDPGLPGDGWAAAQAIAVDDAIPVVMAVDQPSGADLLAAARAGAAGLLDIGSGPERILNALQAAAAGEAVVPRSLVPRLLQEVRLLDEVHGGPDAVVGESARLAALTRREREVLDRLCDGESTARIARRLHVAPVTVRSHVAAIVRKLHVADRDQAVAWMARRASAERLRPVG